MKKLFSITILLLTLNGCAQEKKCTDFKTGEFVYLDKTRPEKVVRTEFLQIETNPETGIEIHSSIEWTSDCNYVMTYKKILNHPKDVSGIIGKKIYIKILETNGNRIKVNAKSDVLDNEFVFIKTD